MKSKKYFLFSILLLISLRSWGQPSFEALQKKLNSLSTIAYSEKIYLHTDRSFYLTGETLWWKAYLVNASNHQPSDLSKIAYLEILDSDNAAVLQAKIEIKDGQSDGGLFIPASLNSGHYRLAAYTRWMQNAPTEYFFYQDITIVNPFRKAQKNVAATTPAAVQFFPEGGNLVMGLPSEVAVLGVKSNGKASYKGAIVSHTGDTVARFQSKQFGLSKFEFTPKAGDVYRAMVHTDGKWAEVPFPVAEPRGVVLHAERAPQSLQVNVRTRQEVGNVYYLAIHNRAVLKAARTIVIRSDDERVTIPYDSLGAGVNHITIFNSVSTPVAERLVFKHAAPTTLTVTTDATEYSKRKKVTATFQWNQERDVQARLSVAVTKMDSLAFFEKTNINTYLLLTSDLKGKIESPSYYFTNVTADKEQLLDLVMETHGWSRFVWNQVLREGVAKKFLPEYRGHIVQATIKDASGKSAPGVVSYLGIPGKVIRVYPAISDLQGNTSVELKSFYASKKLYLQTDFRKDSTYTFAVASPFSATHGASYLPSFSLNPKHAKSITERSISMQAASVYEKTLPPIVDKDSSAFYGVPDEQYRLDDYTRFPVLEEVLREYVAGIWVRKRGSNFSFQIPDKVNGRLLNGDPLVLLDGIPIFSVNRLMEVDASKINEIDVIERPYYLNGVTFNGIASFRTYAGDLGGVVMDPKVTVIDYEGLQPRKEYYAPSYSTPLEAESRLPDRRTLLLWKPNETIVDGKNLTLEFYTSDIKGIFQVDVQGIDNKGCGFSQQLLFEVK